jgi:hypothetical protein
MRKKTTTPIPNDPASVIQAESAARGLSAIAAAAGAIAQPEYSISGAARFRFNAKYARIRERTQCARAGMIGRIRSRSGAFTKVGRASASN